MKTRSVGRNIVYRFVPFIPAILACIVFAAGRIPLGRQLFRRNQTDVGLQVCAIPETMEHRSVLRDIHAFLFFVLFLIGSAVAFRSSRTGESPCNNLLLNGNCSDAEQNIIEDI